MIIQCEHLQFELKHGSTFELAEACGNKLTCVAGTIWVTQHHLSDDWVLQSGEILTIENPGKIVISACNECAIFSAQQRVDKHVESGISQTRRLRNHFSSWTAKVEA